MKSKVHSLKRSLLGLYPSGHSENFKLTRLHNHISKFLIIKPVYTYTHTCSGEPWCAKCREYHVMINAGSGFRLLTFKSWLLQTDSICLGTSQITSLHLSFLNWKLRMTIVLYFVEFL